MHVQLIKEQELCAKESCFLIYFPFSFPSQMPRQKKILAHLSAAIFEIGSLGISIVPMDFVLCRCLYIFFKEKLGSTKSVKLIIAYGSFLVFASSEDGGDCVLWQLDL